MELINKNFINVTNNRFLTENVSIFLYSLIKSCRPQNLLEIGAGYSTVFLAQALKELKTTPINSNYNVNHEYWNEIYSPKLEVIENEEMGEVLQKVKTFLKSNSLEKYVKIINKDLYSYIDNDLKKSNKTYDFIWLDYGAGDNLLSDFLFFESILNPNGLIIVHSTLTNLFGKHFLSEMKLETKIGKYSHLEMISFLEPHKSLQNSFTVFKKTTNYPLYGIRP